jgi:hypothetical protein
VTAVVTGARKGQSYTCAGCGRTFVATRTRRTRTRPYCSVQCAGAVTGPRNASRRGAQNPRWKGGRHVTVRGYVDVRDPEHPMANKNGYIREHRAVMAEVIGRVLAAGEIVHHVNDVKTDNRQENLWLWPDQRSHIHWHSMLRNGHELRLSMPAVPLAAA